MAANAWEEHSAARGVAMKIAERTGKWVEMDRSKEASGEISIQVPNGIWAGWLSPVFVKEEDLASFLRSVGWRVELPASPK